MTYLNQTKLKMVIAIFLLIGSMGHAFADVKNCKPEEDFFGGQSINMDLALNITSNTSAISPGTVLARTYSPFGSIACDFTGSNVTQNSVYFKNTMSASIKSQLRDSGVDILQEVGIGSDGTVVNIVNSTVSNLWLGNWSQPPMGNNNIAFSIRYLFTAQKGAATLKPFDTGMFLLGHHVDYQGVNIGVPVYLRIVGNLTLLCPTPAVNISATNGGSVNFGTLSPQQMNSGEAISRTFNLNMSVPADCQTGLNISVRLDPNNNTILENKYLDMSNGLQVLLKNSMGDVNYGENYTVGEVLPSSPVSLPYTAILTKVPGSTITSGPFSKTIRIIVSY